MRYVFVCPDIEFMRIQYMDFMRNDRGLVLLGKSRHFFKCLSMLGITESRLVDFLVRLDLNRYFKRRGWTNHTCFVIYARAYESYRSSISRYLRKKFAGCKIVVFYGDLIARHCFDVESVKKNVDHIFSFDRADAEKYGIDWLLGPLSTSVKKMKGLSTEENPIKWDVTFVGHAKNRYDKIILLYEKLTELGFVCDFNISGVPREKQKHVTEIHYGPLDFQSLLKHVVASRCIAEVLQDDGVSQTTRYAEAMLFKKSLLTDCRVFSENAEKPDNVYYFKDVRDISRDLVDKAMEPVFTETREYVKELSVGAMIQTIKKRIEE